MDLYQQYIHVSRYARWLPEEGRRETWEETVDRYVGFFNNKYDFNPISEHVRDAIVNLMVMPSMRCLMTAGPALERENLAGFNCSYLAMNSKRCFAEVLYILMCGTGVGFSCERQEIAKLPRIPNNLEKTGDKIVVQDSKIGWAKAYHAYLGYLYNGVSPNVDYSLIRAAGTPLKIFGGRASGPEPLRRLFLFTLETFNNAKGRKLNSLEVHDIVCMIGEIVVVGGVRRAALISLSNLSDHRMRDAKSGNWYTQNPQRMLANNSVAYTEKPSSEIFMEEWLALIKSKSGERGIFNRVSAANQAAKKGKRAKNLAYGTNPCSEIILRDKQLCNLTEVIVRSDDTLETLKEKVEVATILGTLQATLTKFNFVSEKWSKNTAEEALLGVSLTGIMDNEILSGRWGEESLRHTLRELNEVAEKTNIGWAKKLGINPSAAITCVKPSGTVSQLCDTASGIHCRHNEFYIRNVRIDKKDPLYDFILSHGFIVEDEVFRPDSTAVISFPIKAPEGAITRHDVSALDMLNLWLIYQQEWCDHKPSITVNVKEEEWVEVGAWVYEHFDEVSGISFLPSDESEHTYTQLPYQDMTEWEYNKWLKDHPLPKEVNWGELKEKEDNTIAMQTLACTAGSCEI